MTKARPVRGGLSIDSQWHLDRRVPIALIITIIVQAAALIQWGSGITADVTSLKGEVQKMQQEAQSQASKLDKLGILETEIKHISNSLLRLEAALDRISFGYAADRRADPPLPPKR